MDDRNFHWYLISRFYATCEICKKLDAQIIVLQYLGQIW